jgi:hypothetical protein
MSKPEFPKTLKPEMRYFDQRFIAEKASTTLILSLKPDGTQTNQYDPTASFGVYAWTGEHWKLEDRCDSRSQARSAAARLRKNSK